MTHDTHPRYAMPHASTVERFWSLVDRSGECWLWTGKTTSGYGLWAYHVDSRRYQLVAHRFSWLIAHGSLTPGKQLDHICGVPGCVRPDHLQELTPAEHAQLTSARRTHCRKGHALTEDNLTARGLRQGHRACKTCTKASRSAYQHEHMEAQRRRVNASNARNRERVRAYHRAFYAKNRDEINAWHRAHRLKKKLAAAEAKNPTTPETVTESASAPRKKFTVWPKPEHGRQD